MGSAYLLVKFLMRFGAIQRSVKGENLFPLLRNVVLSLHWLGLRSARVIRSPSQWGASGESTRPTAREAQTPGAGSAGATQISTRRALLQALPSVASRRTAFRTPGRLRRDCF